MGVFDKFKKILFDEEIEEVPAGEEELPERTPKKNFRSESGFVDHNGQKEEDVIKEVVYSPKGDEPEVTSRSTKYGSEEYEKKEDIPRQISRYEEPKQDVEKEIERELEKHHEIEKVVEPEVIEAPVEHKYDFGDDFDKPVVHEEHKKEDNFVQTDKYGLRRDYKAILRNETEVRHGELEHKDYAAIARDKHEVAPGKKPFVVTPVISPVYGILDKNYTPDSVIERNKDTADLGSQKKRLYGKEEKEDKKEEPKVEIKAEEVKVVIEEPKKEDEYIESIKNIIDEDIPKKASVEDMVEDTAEYEAVAPTIEYDEPEIEEEPPVIEEEPIYEEPEEVEEDEMEAPSVSIDTLIDNPMEDEEEAPRQELDDTIETDLFNLIDSMYSKEDEGE